MNPVGKSLISGVAVAALALSVVGGDALRAHVESGGLALVAKQTHPADSVDTAGLLVSISDVPEGDYFREMVRLLRREYVEPIPNERKLAIGAIRGMVGSLQDPRSLYMDVDEFRIYSNAASGRYEGIGVDLIFDDGNMGKTYFAPVDEPLDPAASESIALPRLKVVALTPGGPADRAGVKAGDWVDSIDGHWVIGPDLIKKFREDSQRATPSATKNLPPAEIKKREEIAASTRRLFRTQLKAAMRPTKAKNLLTSGVSGTHKIVWRRTGSVRTTQIEKAQSAMPQTATPSGALALRFVSGASERLENATRDKTQITIDLRNNTFGDFAEMKACLTVLAPSGGYGTVQSPRVGKSRAVKVENGSKEKLLINLIVDETTRGPAEAFTLALQTSNLAKVTGKTGGDRTVLETFSLADGSGYTLVVGEYIPEKAQTKAKAAARMDGLQRTAARDQARGDA